VTSVAEWIKTVPQDTLNRFGINPEKFNDFKVFPRLLFGQYLSAQFELLQEQAEKIGMRTTIHFESLVTDIIDEPEKNYVTVEVAGKNLHNFDHIVICTGHNWPFKHEGSIPGYYDSPYPPSKLALKINHNVAIKGSSLTAIDAIRTLARHNGNFTKHKDGRLSYALLEDSADFKIIMHSRNGMLPAIRFHLEDSHLLKDSILSKEVISKNRDENEGFLSLDFVFEMNFKEKIQEKDPEFFAKVKDMNIESFVDLMMELRERLEPFTLLKAEYTEAEKSIKRKESVYWKEMLAVLSFAMNYPAKYFSAEDMQRLQKVLMPLISIVIAFVPQSSVEEMLSLHEAGVLEIITVDDDSDAEPVTEGGVIYHYKEESGASNATFYQTFIDCVGQPHLSYEKLPYKSLRLKNTVSPAWLKYKDAHAGAKLLKEGTKNVEADEDGNYYLKVPGIKINDNFQAIDDFGALNERVYFMAVPYIGGYNPDYSGLDFCEAASASISKTILNLV
jgi:hypothetical protein